MASLNDTLSHDESQKYLDTNTFGCWSQSGYELIQHTGKSCINPGIENLHFISLAHICTSLGFQQKV